MKYGVDKTDLEHIWKNAINLLEELDSARVFVTGGTGFFGRWLLESIAFAKQEINLNCKVDVLTRNVERFTRDNPHLSDISDVHFYEGDIRDFNLYGKKYTHLIHAATEASAKLNESSPLEMFDVIYKGTKNILNFAKQSEVKKFLYVSSGGVYGSQPCDISHLTEEYSGAPFSLAPNAAYGLGKLVGEHLSAVFCKETNIQLKIARCFAFVGPYLPLDTHFAIGNFIRNILDKESIFINGDGSPLRSYLYAGDLVIWLWTILCQGKPMRIYNVGSENPISILDLANMVASFGDDQTQIILKEQPNFLAKPQRYIPSTQRAREELGLDQYVCLEDGIKKTIEWNKQYDKTKSN